jgi:hypothetical protein
LGWLRGRFEHQIEVVVHEHVGVELDSEAFGYFGQQKGWVEGCSAEGSLIGLNLSTIGK